MIRRSLFVICGAVLIAWSLSTRGKEGMYLFGAGAAILLCTLAVAGLRRFGSARSRGGVPATNQAAMLGSLIGLFAGGLAGARSGFGRVMISIFNPGLPERDFGTCFGAIGGGLLGAFLFAILGAVVERVVRRTPKAPAIPAGDARSEADHE